MCPDCGSLDLTSIPFDLGTCTETGYQDAGARFLCEDCGATGPAEDVLERGPARIAPQRERGGLRRASEILLSLRKGA
jgi:hypothetical protein